jgi:hypothetical protein
VSALDEKIDDLYKQPLAGFTGARNALAKSLTGDDAKRVRALAKPTLVPWAVNQVYWRARAAYDRLLKAGARLRNAQIAALEGQAADVRAAGEAHRRAVADAVGEAERLAAASGSKPSPDALSRAFEALSLAAELSEPPGRLTEAMQPAGFEALAGVTPSAPKVDVGNKKSDARRNVAPQTTHDGRGDAEARRRAANEQAEREAAARERDAQLKKADAAVARAEASEKLARATWERAHDALLAARRERDAVRTGRSNA